MGNSSSEFTCPCLEEETTGEKIDRYKSEASKSTDDALKQAGLREATNCDKVRYATDDALKQSGFKKKGKMDKVKDHLKK